MALAVKGLSVLSGVGQNVLIQGFRNKWFVRLVRLLFLASIFILLWRVADGEEAARLLIDAEPLLLLAGFIALTLQTVFAAFRWRVVASQLGIVIDPRSAVGEYYLSQIANQSLPGGFIGDAGRIIRSRSQAGWVRSAQAVIIERMAGQASLFVLFFVSLGLSLAFPVDLNLPTWILIAAGSVFIGSIVLVFTLIGVIRFNNSALAQSLANLWAATYKTLFAKNIRWTQLGLSFGAVTMNILGFVFASWAVGSQISLTTAFVLVPLILLAMLVPLTVGGWGIREAAAAALFPIAGLASSEGLAASIAFGLIFLAASLPGALVVFLAKKKSINKDGLDAQR